MKKFHKNISAKKITSSIRQRCLQALTRLSREQVSSAATFEPWFVWSAETA